MKKCKILHINDGSAEVLLNRDFHFVEKLTWAEKKINKLLSLGYEVKQIIPQVQPAVQGEGEYLFYNAGFLVYLERETDDDTDDDDDLTGLFEEPEECSSIDPDDLVEDSDEEFYDLDDYEDEDFDDKEE